MSVETDAGIPSPELLLDVIKAQTEIARRGLDLGGVMAFVTDYIQHLTNAGGAIVELAEGDEMVYRAAAGMAKDQLGLRLARHGSLSGMCVDGGAVLRCDDSETDPRVDRDACRKVGLRSMVVAPLIHNENTVGVLKIASAQENAFDEKDVHLLRLMSDLIAAAIYHAVRYETDELYHRATHDTLTDLGNRAMFYDRLRQGLALARRKGTRLGVMIFDMDGLKGVNDTFGHRAGDAAIREVAARLIAASRESDTVARIGGDEFAIILTEVDSPRSAVAHSERLTAEIETPFAFEGQPLPLGASIGVALFPDDSAEIEGLIEKADQSMYANKRTRRCREWAPASPPEGRGRATFRSV